MSKRVLPYFLFAAALPSCALASQIDISTNPGWNGSATIGDIGSPNTSTYGEAITTPSGAATVGAFSLWLEVPVGFEFQAFISPWSTANDELTGSMSYLSGIETATDANLVEYTFSDVDADVTPGTVYMFGITVDNVYAADSNMGGEMGGNLEADGNSTYSFDWANNSGSTPALYSPWGNSGCGNSSGTCGNAAFDVTYDTATPEPGTLTLLSSALLLLAFRVFRRARYSRP